MGHRIFRAAETQPLTAAHYLGDYEAVTIDLTWPRLVGVKGPEPGFKAYVDLLLVREVKAALERRTKELLVLLLAGGVLAVKVRARSVLEWTNSIGTQSAEVTTDEWLVGAIPSLHSWYEPFELGSGDAISISEPGHPLEQVIRNATGYSALLRNTTVENQAHVVLAKTRIGDAIAAEIPVGNGLVMLLPTGIDDAALTGALEQLLDDRSRYRTNWMLPRETELINEANRLRAALQQEVRKLESEMDEVANIRVAAMKDIHVGRAIRYYENGISATRDVKTAMHDLYKLVEMLEAQVGGSEDALAAALAVPKSRFKHIKKLANQKDLDFRHATSGEPIGADAADIHQAREDARALVQKFIELRCEDEAKRRASSAAVADPSRSH